MGEGFGKTVIHRLSDEFNAPDEMLSEILDGLIRQFQSTFANRSISAWVIRL